MEIPADIQKIAPSGYLAQIMLYSIAPDKMVGWGSKPKEDQMKYIDEKYADKPEFGAFYGKNTNLNMEALIQAGSQVVIDLGEPKDDIFKYDMVKQAQEFYKLFYHYDLSEDEAGEMLKNSILKGQ